MKTIEINTPKYSPSKKLNNETAEICTEIDLFIGLLNKHAYRAKGYSLASIQHFDSLEKMQQENILKQFRKYSELCFELSLNGVSFHDNKKLTNMVLKKIGMVGPKNFCETLESEDIVEIYNTDGVQIFRSFSFYDYCSYNLLDLISYPWYELLERHTSITESIADHIKIVLASDCNNAITSNVPLHSIRELFSEEQNVFTSRFNFFAPLFVGAGSKTGFICSGRLQNISHSPGSIKFL